ncbi:MAG: hypothetical protein HYY16_08300 [Planctomycetes bacterium]|nr:hypothetical protein [Planctomycetota bacterium]
MRHAACLFVIFAGVAAGCSVHDREPQLIWYKTAPVICRNAACRACGGHGDVTCDSCDGRGYDPCTDCRQGKVACDECTGSGRDGTKPCEECSGSGKVDCEECDGEGKLECDDCLGFGKVHCIENMPVPAPPQPEEAWPQLPAKQPSTEGAQ